jgi:AMMECR1 domain-containing protein
MSNISLKGQVVLEYLEKFPNTTSRMLARIIYRDNMALFTTLDSTRLMIRYYRGSVGDTHRKALTNKKYVRKFKTIEHEQIQHS